MLRRVQHLKSLSTGNCWRLPEACPFFTFFCPSPFLLCEVLKLSA